MIEQMQISNDEKICSLKTSGNIEKEKLSENNCGNNKGAEENITEKTVIDTDIDSSNKRELEETNENNCANFISPPKKKLRQDPLPFPKISKEEVLEKQLKDVVTPDKKQALKELNASGISNGSTSPDDVTEKNTKKVSSSAKKRSPISKEEKQKLKELKEQQKQQRLKEMEEKKKKKEEERIRKEEEKLKKEIEKQAEKERKELEKKEKERIKEEEKRKKDEEKRKKEEEREAERKQKEAERKQKEAEKEKKDAEKRLEEEKKKQEEEAARRKQERISSNFKSFFTKKQTKEKQEDSDENNLFHPFQLKPGMVLAPLIRKKNFDQKKFDDIFEKDTYSEKESIIDCLKSKYLSQKYITRRSIRKKERDLKAEKCNQEKNNDNKKTVICISDDEYDDDDDDDADDDDDVNLSERNLYAAKLLQFSENTRPAFYGTWRKSTKKINGRRIFGLDKDVFNYDIDSDEEWIDEPGENLSDVDEGEEKDEEETEDDHDGFFVPHGYLSDDEGIPDSDNEENEEMENPVVQLNKDMTSDREREKLNAKLSTLEAKFLKNKVKARKPLCIGVSFTNDISEVHNLLQSYKVVPLLQDEDTKDNELEKVSPSKMDIDDDRSHCKTDYNSPIPLTIPDEAMPIFLKYLHGNMNGQDKMFQVFTEFWSKYVKSKNLSVRSAISKTQFRLQVQKIASRSFSKELQKICYFVNEEILEKYELANQRLGEGLPLIDNLKSNNDLATPLSLDKDTTPSAIGNEVPSDEKENSCEDSFTKLNDTSAIVID